MEKPERARGVATLRARAPTREFSMPTIREYSTPADSVSSSTSFRSVSRSNAGDSAVVLLTAFVGSGSGSGGRQGTMLVLLSMSKVGRISPPGAVLVVVGAPCGMALMPRYRSGRSAYSFAPRTNQQPRPKRPGWRADHMREAGEASLDGEYPTPASIGALTRARGRSGLVRSCCTRPRSTTATGASQPVLDHRCAYPWSDRG